MRMKLNFMRSNLALALLCINLISSGLIAFFFTRMPKSSDSQYYKLDNYILYLDYATIFFIIILIISF